MKRFKGILAALGVFLFAMSAYATAGSTVYPALPGHCVTMAGHTTTTSGGISNSDPNNPAQVWCYTPYDSAVNYAGLTAYISSCGGSPGNGSINGTACTGSVCLAVCQVGWGSIASCGPVYAYTGGYTTGTAFTGIFSGWVGGAENVVVFELGSCGMAGVYSYAVAHN